MKTVNSVVLSAVDTASATGIQIDSQQLLAVSFQSVFGDVTAAGTVKVQMSNDINPMNYSQSNFVVTNWSDIPSATSTVAAGVAPPISLPQGTYPPARWLRVVFTRTGGGSSTITITMFGLSV